MHRSGQLSLAAFLGLIALLAAGCGHARLVNRDLNGGVYALEGDRNKAMEEAHQQMSAHCRGPYTIVSEGENVVGEDSAQSTETFVTKDGTVVKQGGKSTRQAVEWRVQYQCGQSAVPGQPPSASPSPSPSYDQPQQQTPPAGY